MLEIRIAISFVEVGVRKARILTGRGILRHRKCSFS